MHNDFAGRPSRRQLAERSNLPRRRTPAWEKRTRQLQVALLLGFGLLIPGCICTVICVQFNGASIAGNCGPNPCGGGGGGGGGSGHEWVDPCNSPSWWDADRDSMSDATETNPSNDYLRLNKDRWDANPSIARGVPTDGSLTGGLNLSNSSGFGCNGYYHYAICDTDSVSQLVCEQKDRGDWGTARLIWLIERSALAWRYLYGGPRMGVGHLSLQNGGRFVSYFNSVNTAHVEHRNGLQVDIRYVRRDGVETGLDLRYHPEDLDSVRNAQLVNLFIQSPFVREIIIDDRTGVLAGSVGAVVIRNDRTVHHNHFHVTVWDPDGRLN